MIATPQAFLVRHAKAGDRDAWTEPDEVRPLSPKGRLQAEALVAALADVDLKRILTSPYLRCRQTVQPLALRRGLALVTAPELAEGAKTQDALELLYDAATSGPAVLCSHGDVIPAMIEGLVSLGMAIDGEPGWKKGSIWALDRDATRFVRARYLGTPLGT